MDERYDLGDIAMMTGFTTRTLRNYMSQGFLKGEKINGVWRFTAEELDAFFSEPFVKESLRVKRSAAVFDFLADRAKKTERICVILDIPASIGNGNRISAFFCERMREASDTSFTYDWDKGVCRVILNGAADQVGGLIEAYRSADIG